MAIDKTKPCRRCGGPRDTSSIYCNECRIERFGIATHSAKHPPKGMTVLAEDGTHRIENRLPFSNTTKRTVCTLCRARAAHLAQACREAADINPRFLSPCQEGHLRHGEFVAQVGR